MVFKEFVHYDFQSPIKLPGEGSRTVYMEAVLTRHDYLGNFKGAFDRILCDPPFLSADCQTKGTCR